MGATIVEVWESRLRFENAPQMIEAAFRRDTIIERHSLNGLPTLREDVDDFGWRSISRDYRITNHERPHLAPPMRREDEGVFRLKLAQLIARQERALAQDTALRVELVLLRIGPVGVELVAPQEVARRFLEREAALQKLGEAIRRKLSGYAGSSCRR